VALAYLAVSWLLVQIVETLFPVFGLSNALIKLVVIVLTIGFPLVLIISWLYELTPEGLKKDKDVDRSRSIAHHTGKKLDRAIIVVLVLSLGYFAFDKFVLDPARDVELVEQATEQARNDALVESYGANSIAVLPFVNMSSDEEQEYFSDGISEELLNLLSKVQNLRVISRSSSFTFKGKDIDIRTIAAQLNVAHILEGSVRRAGTKVRITAQLIEARTDTHLWSETYDRELNDIFAIQDEISAAIVAELRESLGLENEAIPKANATANSEAYEAYLRGVYLLAHRTETSVAGAVREFGNSVRLDPDYASAHAQLAMATLIQTFNGDRDKLDAIALAELHVERAMILDPTIAETYAASGLLAFHQGKIMGLEYYGKALGDFEQAIRINPNYSDVYHWIGLILEIYGEPRFRERFAVLQKALELNPLSIPALSAYIVELLDRHRFSEADVALEKLASIKPSKYLELKGFRLSVEGGRWAYQILGVLDGMQLVPLTVNYQSFMALLFVRIELEDESLAMSSPPNFNTLLWSGQPRNLLELTENTLTNNPKSENARHQLGFALAATGNYTRAQPMWEDYWQKYGGNFDGYDTLALVAIRRAAGDEAGAKDLLVTLQERMAIYAEAGISDAGAVAMNKGLAAFFDDDQERGLKLISKAVEEGHFILLNLVFLQSLYDHPDFTPILAKQEARQKRERDRFLTIVCNDNPYEDVWQPEMGTCEQFAAEGGN